MAELIRLGAYRRGSQRRARPGDRASTRRWNASLSRTRRGRSTGAEAFGPWRSVGGPGAKADDSSRARLLARLERHALDEQRLVLAGLRGRAWRRRRRDRQAGAAAGGRAHPRLDCCPAARGARRPTCRRATASAVCCERPRSARPGADKPAATVASTDAWIQVARPRRAPAERREREADGRGRRERSRSRKPRAYAGCGNGCRTRAPA